MIATLLLACTALHAPGLPQGEARVLAQDTDGFGPAGRVDLSDPAPVAIPFVTRSPLVRRVVPGPRGLMIRVEGPVAGVRVEALRHRSDSQVVVADGRAHLVGPPTLPRRAQSADGNVLPELARRDGVGVRAAALLALEGPPDLTRVSLGDRAWVGTDPGDAWLDQVFFAEVAPVAGSVPLEPLATTREGDALELRLAVPPGAGRGETWTLLVTVEPGARAAEASAPALPRDEVGGFLRDVATEAGAAFLHFEGPDEQLDIRPTMGPGVAWGDVDHDGWMDLYLVQGGGRAGSLPAENRLLRNVEGTFYDVTALAGANDAGAGMGALFLDASGDGELELYVANYGRDVVYQRRALPAEVPPRGESAYPFHESRYDPVHAALPGHDLWSAGVAASDYDLDGDLDLYVTSYLLYDESLMPGAGDLDRYRREDPIAMLPFAFPGQRNTFLRNDSDAEGLAFTDVTADLKLLDEAGRGMQPVFWDFDRDRDDDLYVANDVSYNVLWRNEGPGSRTAFRDVSFMTGMDDPRGGMGVAIGDVDLDGDEDLFLTNWELEANALYRNNLLSHTSQRHRVATFRDVIVPSGLGPFGVGATSWGAELFDADNDTDLDLFVANGYTSPDYESTGICVGQPNHFFWNDGTGKFTDGAADAGPALAVELPSRAAVACDYDRDGDVDLVVTANNAPLQLLRNDLPEGAKGHWLVVRLRGRGKNTQAIGAEVTVRLADGPVLRRSLRAGTSYLGGNPAELHFGLGEASEVGEVVVRWPSGGESRHRLEGVDRYVVIEEGE